MKKIYFAGKFNKHKDNTLSLENRLKEDYRSKLLGSSKLLTYHQENLIIDNKFIYIGPFYCEQASSGNYTSTDCQDVLMAEYEAIKNADQIIIVFDNSFSVGSIVELNWAINHQKEIIILYQEEESSYTIKSEYWFAILDAINRADNIEVMHYRKNENIAKLVSKHIEKNL